MPCPPQPGLPHPLPASPKIEERDFGGGDLLSPIRAFRMGELEGVNGVESSESITKCHQGDE